MKTELEDVLFVGRDCKHKIAEYNRVFTKTFNELDNICQEVRLTQETLENLVKDELKDKYYLAFVKYFKINSNDCKLNAAKNSHKSVEARIRGNELLAKEEHNVDIHNEIWKLYSKSIALAPSGSKELVLAYECRSNLLLHFKKYEDCIKDIDKALSLTEFDLLKVKLLCRKITCLVAMNKDVVEKKDLWKTLEYHLEKIDIAFKDEKFLKMIDQVKSDVCIQPNSQIKHEPERFTAITAFSNITLTQNKERHFLADRDYKTGEPIIVTKPTITGVNPDKFYAYCSYCLSFMWAGIPCDECSLFMYCSGECKVKAWTKYHMLECKVSPHINVHHPIYYELMNSIKIFMMGVREFGSITNLVEKVREIDESHGDANLMKSNKFFDSEFLNFYTMPSLLTTDLCSLSHSVKNTCFLMAYLTQTLEDIFEKEVESMTGKELAKDRNFVYGSVVMLKIMILCGVNVNYPFLSERIECPQNKSKDECNLDRCCPVGSIFHFFKAFFEKSCNPNMSICHTQDGKKIYFAAQPIKKMEMLTVNETLPFYQYDKIQRHIMGPSLRIVYGFCGCPACAKDWPAVLVDCNKYRKKFLNRSSKLQTKGSEILIKYLRKMDIKTDPKQYFTYNKEEFQELAEDANIVLETCGQPSFASSFMTMTLCQAFRGLHGDVSIRSHVPKDC